MIIRVSKGSKGLSEYLEHGNKKGRELHRDIIDERIQEYGNQQLFKETIDYLDSEENYKNNYMHITVSYTDLEYMTLTDKERNEITEEVIKFYSSGYNINTEVVAIGETHYPKVKYDELGQKRYPHTHIGIALHNPLTNTQMTPPQFTKFDEILQSYLNKKYNLKNPKDYKRKIKKSKEDIFESYKIDNKKSNQTINAELRDILSKELSSINTVKELQNYTDKNNLKLILPKEKVKNPKFTINIEGRKVNLNGKKFRDLEARLFNREKKEDTKGKWQKELDEIKDLTQNDLKEKLDKRNDYRIGYIADRNLKARNKAYKKMHEESYDLETVRDYKIEYDNKPIIYNKANSPIEQIKYENENKSKYKSYQNKVAYAHYKDNLQTDLLGYSVDTKSDTEQVSFINSKKNIKVLDYDSIIETNSDSENLTEKVSLMLDIAEAKKYKIENLKITGTQEFQDESYRQIENRLELKETKEINTTQEKEETNLHDIVLEVQKSEEQNRQR